MNNPPLPRGHKNAFAYYVENCRREFETNNPNEAPNFVEFIQNCIANYKTLSEAEKEPFVKLSEQDKQRFEKEMAEHPQAKVLEEQTNSRKRKPEADVNPRRPLAAFYWYCEENRSILMKSNPQWGIGQIAIALGKQWIDADSAVKQIYEGLADKDLARFEAEMEVFRKKDTAKF